MRGGVSYNRSLHFVFLFSCKVPAGQKRCLYDEMGIGHKPHLFVSVLDGGKHDIHFTVILTVSTNR